MYMGRCQNYGPFLGTLNIKCRTIIRTQKGTIILTTTHMGALQVHRESRILPGLAPQHGLRTCRAGRYRQDREHQGQSAEFTLILIFI